MSKPRLPQLDLLRGIAILLVIGHHAIKMPAGGLSTFRDYWQQIGWTGVDLFFVLSGFLVGGLLMDEIHKYGSVRVGRFLVRRAFKIWPLYYLYLIAATAFRAKSSGNSLTEVVWNLLPNYLHLQNYFDTPLRHTWSLGVEEHFYLALPLILGWLVKQSKAPKERIDGWIKMSVVICVSCLGMRIISRAMGGDSVTNQWPTHLRLDSLMVGVTLAYIVRFIPSLAERIKSHPIIWAMIGIAAISPTAFLDLDSAYISTVGYSIIAWGYFLLTFLTVSCFKWPDRSKNLVGWAVAEFVAAIGFYSYPIYLFHFGLGQMPAKWVLAHIQLNGYPELRWILVTSVNIVTVLVIGVILGRVMERPTLALRDFLFPSRTEPLSSAPNPEATPKSSASDTASPDVVAAS